MTERIQDIRDLDRGGSKARSRNHRNKSNEGCKVVGEITTTERSGLDAMADGEFLDVPQVAKYLNVSKSMVYKMVENRQIHAIRFGRLVRIRRCDLEQAIRDLSCQ